MASRLRSRLWPALALGLLALSLGGCGHLGGFDQAAQLSDKECMARVMYFESNRSSEEGMRAVGTVVMNRLSNPRYPKTVCGVIGQNKQFADGALTKPVPKRSKSWALAERVAGDVLDGDRHDPVGSALFFHTVGYTYPYRNMHYVTLAGGNAFYEKRTPGTFVNDISPVPTMVASAEKKARPTMVAQAQEQAQDDEPAPVRARSRAVEEDDETDTPPAPRARTVAAPREPAPEPRRPVLMAGASRSYEPQSDVEPSRYAPVPRGADQTRAAPISAAERPKPVVVAMLSPPASAKPRATKPRSIEDLIAMDLAQQ